MNNRTDHNLEWPQTLHTDAAGMLWIEGPYGERMELEAFKGICRRRAVELRERSMGQAIDAAGQALRRAVAASRLVLTQQRQHAAFQRFHPAGQLRGGLLGYLHVLLERR